MNILVTGATGFLGTALCTRLEAEGHTLTRLNSRNADLTKTESLNQLSGYTYDQIYHLAAWTQAGDFCLHHPGEQWIINQQINTNILSWWSQYQPRAKFICMGTSCAYAPENDLIEENYLIGKPIDSLFTYAMTKRMLYVGLQALNKQYHLNYLCLVPSTLYGPGYHTDGRQMHFIFDLIRKILRGKLYNEAVVLWGDGYQRRELVYIDDFINTTLKLVDSQKNELINIGAGEEFTIRHFAQIICNYVDFPFEKIQFDTHAYVGAKSKCLGVDKLKNLIPNLSYTPLDKGIANTIDWFLTESDKTLPALS
jgi:GDP-L-fucose synthase